jgi:hypothetical protein
MGCGCKKNKPVVKPTNNSTSTNTQSTNTQTNNNG